MNPLAVVLPVVVTVAVLVMLVGLTRRRGAARPAVGVPYVRQRALFTQAERSFLGSLERALEGRYRVMGKVRVADVLRVKSGLHHGERRSAFNRISAKHVDFVLLEPEDLSVVAAIELDDRSHEVAGRRVRDGFLDEAFTAAGVPLHHFGARHGYALPEVRAALQTLLVPVVDDSPPDGDDPDVGRGSR